MDIGQIERILTDAARGGALRLPATALDSPGIERLFRDHLPAATLALDGARAERDGDRVRVSGTGADGPLAGTAVDAWFAMGADQAQVRMTATATEAWTLASAFPALRHTMAAEVRTAGAPVLTLRSAAEGDTAPAGMWFQGAVALSGGLEPLRWLAGGADALPFAGPVAAGAGGLPELAIAAPVTGDVEIGYFRAPVTLALRTTAVQPEAPGAAPFAAAEMRLTARLSWTAGPRTVHLPVTAAFQPGLPVVRFALDLNEVLDAALHEFAALLDGHDLGALVPDDWHLDSVLRLGDLVVDVDLRTPRLLGVSLSVRTTRSWTLVPDVLALREAALVFSLADPLGQPRVALGVWGSVGIAGGVVEVYGAYPEWSFGTHLREGTAIDLRALAAHFVPSASDALPALAVSALDLDVRARERAFAGGATLASDWSVPLGDTTFAIHDVWMTVDHPGGGQPTAAAVGGDFALGPVRFGVSAAVAEHVTLAGSIPTLPLSRLLAELLGAGVAEGMPEVEFHDLAFRVTPATGEFHVAGTARSRWTVGSTVLDTTASLAVTRARSADDPDRHTVEASVEFATGAPVQVLDGFSIDTFRLAFARAADGGWTLGGAVTGTVLSNTFSLAPEYAYRDGQRRLRLDGALAGDLLSLPGVATLTAARFGLELEDDGAGGRSWQVDAAGTLRIHEVHDFTGTLRLYHTGADSGLELRVADPALELPLVPPDVRLAVRAAAVRVVRHTAAGGAEWRLEAAATTAVSGLPEFLYTHGIVAREQTTTLRIDGTGATLTLDPVTPAFDLVVPDIVFPDGTRVDLAPVRALGAASVAVTGLRVTLGREIAAAVRVGIGLPARLNDLFGVRDGAPVWKVFRTRPDVVELEFGIGYVARTGSAGIVFELRSSPFHKLELADGALSLDLGEAGAVDVQLPVFQAGSGGFTARDLGWTIRRPLRVPLAPARALLRRVHADAAAALLPDAIPLLELRAFDADGHVQADVLIRFLNDQLAALGAGPLPDTVTAIVREVARRADRLPAALKEYLDFRIPDSLRMDLSVTPDGGVNVAVRVDPEHPLRLLAPGLSGVVPLPALQGVTLRGFSLGTHLGGSLFSLSVDADFDTFDLASLLAGIALPDVGVLPPAKDFHRRVLVHDLWTLVVIAGGIPVPIPLFYSRLGVEYLGIEGTALQAHVAFPMPRLDPARLVRVLLALRTFLTDPQARLDPDQIPPELGPRFWLEDCWLQLPPYLGGALVGRRGRFAEFDVLPETARLLNAVKFLTPDQVVALVPLDDRVASAELRFVCLAISADLLLTTPAEFRDGAYARLRLAPEQVAAYLALLGDAEHGVAAVVRGTGTLGEVARLDTSFGLVAAGGRGFATQFSVQGDVRGVVHLRLAGAVSLVLSHQADQPSTFALDGESRLTVLGIEVFRGDLHVHADGDRFRVQGDFRLLPEGFPVNAHGAVDGTVSHDGLDVRGEVSAALGLVVLAGARAVVDNAGARVEATWLGASVALEVRDENGRWALDFGADLVVGRIGAHIAVDRAARTAHAELSATLLGIFGLRVWGDAAAAVHDGTRLQLHAPGGARLVSSARGAPALGRSAGDGWFVVHDARARGPGRPLRYGDPVFLRAEPAPGAPRTTGGGDVFLRADAAARPLGGHPAGVEWTLADPADPASTAPLRPGATVVLRSAHPAARAVEDAGAWVLATAPAAHGELAITHLGMTVVTGVADASLDGLSFSASLCLLPRGAPLTVTGALSGWLRRDGFLLQGSSDVSLGPVSWAGGSATCTGTGVELAGTWLGLPARFAFHDEGQRVAASFQLAGPIVPLDVGLAVDKGGYVGSARINASFAGALTLDAGFDLPQPRGHYALVVAGTTLAGGEIWMDPYAGVLGMNGQLSLGIASVAISGSLGPNGLYLSGEATAGIPGLTFGIRVTLDNGMPSIYMWDPAHLLDFTARIDVFQGLPSLLATWEFAWTCNYLVINANGVIWTATVRNAPQGWPADWPGACNPYAGGGSVAAGRTAALRPARADVLHGAVRVLLAHDWAEPPETLAGDLGGGVAQTLAAYPLALQARPLRGSDGWDTRLKLHRSRAREDWFTEMRARVLERLRTDPRTRGLPEPGALIDVRQASATFRTVPDSGGRVELRLRVRRNGRDVATTVPFSWDDPDAAWARIAEWAASGQPAS